MRIGVNARLLGNAYMEGVGNYTDSILRCLTQLSPDDQFILYTDKSDLDLSYYGPNTVSKNLLLPARHPYLWHIWFEWLMPAAMRRDNINVMFSPEGMLSLGTNIPTLMTTHDIVFEYYPQYLKRHHAKYLMSNSKKYHDKATHIMAVSQFTADTIEQRYHIDPSKITIAYNGCSDQLGVASDLDKRTFAQEMGLDAPYFLYVGSLHPRKNIKRIIEAFERLKQSYRTTHKLVLAGRLAWLSSDIEDQLSQSVYQEDIIHLDYYRGDLNLLYNCADALIYPSLFEGFGLPVLEAMRTGTPVITSRGSAMAEITGTAAILIDPYSVDEIIKAMNTIINNGRKIEELIKDGLVRAAHFNWQKSAQQVYCQLKLLTDRNL